MRKYLFTITFILLLSQQIFAWGNRGHAIVACIAEKHLTPKAKINIEKYLNGKSIIYYASWMDFYRRTPEYKQTSIWHEAPCDNSFYHTDTVAWKDGDAVSALKAAIDTLSNYHNLNDSTVAANIRYIVHLMGDMHCPCHIKYPGIFTYYKIKIKGVEYPYHAVWDSYIIEHYRSWSYSEWEENIDKKSTKEIETIVKGNIDDWFHENAIYCQHIYEMVPENTDLNEIQSLDFLNTAIGIAEHQLLDAGYRLSFILNNIFEK